MIETKVMGGWLQINDVEVHEIDRGIWEGLIVHFPIDRTYIPANPNTDLASSTTDRKWAFLVFDEQRFMPDRFTEGDLEYVKLATIVGGGRDIDSGLVYRLLEDALVYAGSGKVYSRHARDEWEQIVRGYLKSVGHEQCDGS